VVGDLVARRQPHVLVAGDVRERLVEVPLLNVKMPTSLSSTL
jgi:hypothetical protein